MDKYKDLLGVKYSVHGRNKEEGFDCYGIVIEVLRRNGIVLNDVFYDTTDDWSNITKNAFISTKLIKLDKLEENCIILISVNGEPKHIGVYIGDGLIIHSTSTCGVVIQSLYIYKKRIMGLYKVVN